jgi:N-acetylmuramoyl-L-alanine amidase CwlA
LGRDTFYYTSYLHSYRLVTCRWRLQVSFASGHVSNLHKRTVLQLLTDYIKIHDNGVKAFKSSLEKCETIECVKDLVSDLISTYFYETSLLFRMAAVSVPATINMKKIVEELPDKKEFKKIKIEANSQYDKFKTGLELVKKTLGETKARNKRGESIYG